MSKYDSTSSVFHFSTPFRSFLFSLPRWLLAGLVFFLPLLVSLNFRDFFLVTELWGTEHPTRRNTIVISNTGNQPLALLAYRLTWEDENGDRSTDWSAFGDDILVLNPKEISAQKITFYGDRDSEMANLALENQDYRNPKPGTGGLQLQFIDSLGQWRQTAHLVQISIAPEGNILLHIDTGQKLYSDTCFFLWCEQ